MGITIDAETLAERLPANVEIPKEISDSIGELADLAAIQGTILEHKIPPTGLTVITSYCNSKYSVAVWDASNPAWYMCNPATGHPFGTLFLKQFEKPEEAVILHYKIVAYLKQEQKRSQ